jgi:hypothetical protein
VVLLERDVLLARQSADRKGRAGAIARKTALDGPALAGARVLACAECYHLLEMSARTEFAEHGAVSLSVSASSAANLSQRSASCQSRVRRAGSASRSATSRSSATCRRHSSTSDITTASASDIPSSPSSPRKNASLLGSLRAERLVPRRDRSGNMRCSWRRTQVNRVASRRQRRSQCYPPDWITGIVLRARGPNGTARAQRAPSLDGANLPSPAASGRGWRARQRAPGEGTVPEDARFRGPLTLPALRPFGRLRRVPPSPALAGEGRSTMRWAERSITEASAG